jgi:serine/threonine protein kinase
MQTAAELVPGYRIVHLIGEGGSAKVYLAERASDKLQLVLKILDPSLREDARFLKRFVREYQLIAATQSEHLPVIFDHGFTGEQAYIAMEYFGGGDLKERIRAGFTSRGALRVASQIAKALCAIHERGVIHRDLKPQNILFRDNQRLALVDFGLARRVDIASTLTGAGEVLATPRYMSPEQCIGAPADHRSDLYSLGVILYEMLAGRKLFEGESAAGLLYMHVNGDVPRLPAKLAGYQPIVDRLLAKQPQDRYQSARELFGTIAI